MSVDLRLLELNDCVKYNEYTSESPPQKKRFVDYKEMQKDSTLLDVDFVNLLSSAMN